MQPNSDNQNAIVCCWCGFELAHPAKEYEYCPKCDGSFSFRKPTEPNDDDVTTSIIIAFTPEELVVLNKIIQDQCRYSQQWNKLDASLVSKIVKAMESL